jgi:hypothetical protein
VVLITFITTGCANKFLPERFSSVHEAYPEERVNITPDLPQDSYKKTVFDVPYDDVFRAVTVAITQLSISVESSDKGRGVILAMSDQGQERNLYAVSVKKIGLGRTEIIIGSKYQKRCQYMPVSSFILYSIFTFGIVFLAGPLLYLDYNECNELSTVHWKADPKISAIIVQTRNNLIKSGEF